MMKLKFLVLGSIFAPTLESLINMYALELFLKISSIIKDSRVEGDTAQDRV